MGCMIKSLWETELLPAFAENAERLSRMGDLVSVIMPSYNTEKYIAESIRSVLAQTYENWELIIVDDCSSDHTDEIVAAFKDDRICYIKNEQNCGAAISRNRAIDAAKGRYIAFLDSDDLWHPEKLERQLRFMQDTGAAFSFTAYDKIDGEGQKLPGISVPPAKADYKKFIRCSNPIGNLTVIYDAARLGKVMVPNISKRNDFALWLQILKKLDYGYGMKDILGSYRIRENSLSRNKLKLISHHFTLYRKIEGHGIIRSIYEVACWAVVKGVLKKTVWQ